MRCSVFILTANTDLKILEQSINTVKAGLSNEDELVVITNNATKQVMEFLKKKKEKLLVFREPTAFAAYNYASELSKAKFVAILNDDVRAERDWLEYMITCLNETGVSMAGYERHHPFISHEKQVIHRLHTREKTKHVLDWLVGWCLLVNRKDFLRIGGFSVCPFGPLKNIYCEDNDLSIKFRSFGYDIALIKKPKIKHLEDKAKVVNKRNYAEHNRHQLYLKWGNVTELKGKFLEW